MRIVPRGWFSRLLWRFIRYTEEPLSPWDLLAQEDQVSNLLLSGRLGGGAGGTATVHIDSLSRRAE